MPRATAAGSDAGDSVEDRVDSALSRVLRALTREKVRQSRTTGIGRGLSATDMWLVAYLNDHDSVRLSDLAAWQAVDKSTITMQVKRLVEAGLVERTPDPTDRRAVRVSLTDHGWEVLRVNREQARHFIAQLLGEWSPEDREHLAYFVNRLADAVDASLIARP